MTIHHFAPRPRRPRPRRRPPPPRPRPRRRRRRRAVPRISPVRDAGVRQRPAQAGDLRHRAGLRPARRQGRGGRLCARLRPVRGRARARGRRGARGQGRLFRPLRGRRPAAPMCASTATRIRSATPSFETKVRLLETIDAYARAKDPRVRQVSVSFGGYLAGGRDPARRRRELSRRAPAGARQRLGRRRRRRPPGIRQLRLWRPRGLCAASSTSTNWQHAVDEAVRQALVNLEAVPAPAGEMDVVLGPGWPGVMLHEAVGHGLEGDFNRKKTSAFAGLMGQRSPPRASPWSTTAPWRSGAARSRSTTRARRPAAPC